MKQRVKTAKYRKISSTKWLQRHINDKHVIAASKMGYRSRSAIKLLDIEKKFHIIGKASVILDIGSAPGGWLQVATQKCNKKINKIIIGVDLKEIKPIEGATIIQGDFCEQTTIDQIILKLRDKELLNTDNTDLKIDLITSDMAPSTCGNKETDHLRIMNLVEKVIDFAQKYLDNGGSLIMKIFMGKKEPETRLKLKALFKTVHIFKPEGSYKESSEIFFVCINKFNIVK